MIPFQTVLLIEEVEEREGAVRRFTLVDQEDNSDSDEEELEDRGDAQS
jgi:hypothetical protein